MKKSNKLLALLLIGAFSLQACGNQEGANDTNKDEETTTEQTTSVDETKDSEENKEAEDTNDESEDTTDEDNDEDSDEDEDSDKNEEVTEMTGDELDKIEEDDKKKEDYLVIDVRDEDAYKEGHIKHAISIPADELEDKLSDIEDWKDKSVVVYADTADDSKDAYNTLKDNDFTDVYNAEGFKDYEYTTTVKFETVLGDEFKELAESGDYTIVDGRDAKDYDEGHMPGAINVPSDQVDELVSTLPTDKPFLTYCYSGNKSSVIDEKLTEDDHEVINAFDGTKEYDDYDLSEK
ncbi:rhodanese-like domain-containing protein [uncultured Anaerococcus sp.]|uniref:rhodanese-like domain-containing protein n=1 Tax=uncultured Anaerococcus sp. TaxID=293428 RepID=UPI002634E457|nr:rhodanese-like domain-containing protein [uncultured Anaerococcus sp.]